MSYLFVPGTEESTSDCGSRCRLLARSVSWRGKLRPAKSWSAACRKGGWIQRLFGQMPRPSTADHGVESWIASLRESRANLGAPPESARGSRTNGTLAKSWSAWLTKWDQDSFSWRTSPGLFDSAPPTFSGDWPTSGTMRSGECFPLPESAPLIEGNESSCWPIGEAWPTPDAGMRGGTNSGGAKPGPERPTLERMGRMWPTATAADSKGSGSAAYSTESGRHAGTTLTDAMKGWATPRASDGEKGGPNQRDSSGRPGLPSQAAHWSTPTARDCKHPDRPGSGNYQRKLSLGWTIDLNSQAAAWATPTASDDKSETPKIRPGHSPPLSRQALLPGSGSESTQEPGRQWMTPRVANIKGSEKRRASSENHSLDSQAREVWAENLKARLNPDFVEWLMGLPHGWTSSECSETAWSHWLQLMRSALSPHESTHKP